MKMLLSQSPELLLLVFLIITFLQSGIDKIVDWQGNISWLKSHFEKTMMRSIVPILVVIILIVELLAALLCAIGLYQLLTSQSKTIALYGAILSCLCLLMLLFGQRIAKDYDGARTIVIYFVPAVFTVFLLAS